MEATRRVRELGFQRGRYQSPWEFPMAAQNLAVILIQKRVRGMLCRLRQASGTSKTVSTSNRRKGGRTRSPMQQFVARGGSFSDERGFRAFAATRLQAWFRMQRQRWRATLARFPLYHIAALQLQYTWKAHYQHALFQRQTRGSGSAAPLSPANGAALCLQAAWKSYTQRRIFRYYRDLLTFRSTGDPARMLRAINPGEAGLLDASMGAQVRFRLGGLVFPPTIYYKIFTRRPVCDLGAFSPKDYTLARQGAPVSHSHARRSRGQTESATFIRVGNSYYRARQQEQDTRLWYRRLENNGWRPVTAKVLAEANADPIAQATGGRRAVAPAGGFHYSKLVRQQDRESARRHKKRLWMQKLYTQGLLVTAPRPERHQQDEEGEEEDDGDKRRDQPALLFDVDFEDENWENEAEDMFLWAEALDYDEYVANWQELGRTAATDEDL
ncbi:hypothetical protein BBJ28_00002024 [Nothophytophthora sp. Chile5]|nr:hypothetical protein BBJ28_00002024 [Nothophytophthora sp. Chile5]